MKSISIREAREALTHLEELVTEHGEITITRRGRPIARLVPVPARKPVPSHADLRARMRPMVRGSEELIREDRDSGA